MEKYEFLTELCARLWALPEEDAKRSVDYYSEMIDDRMEDGMTEEAAVAAIGDVDEIAKSILANASLPKPEIQPKKAGRKHRWWEILLLILGSPIWLSLIIAAAAVIFAVWASLWSVVISLYAVTVALGASSVGFIFGNFFMLETPGAPLVTLGIGLVCAGLAIVFFIISDLAAKGMVRFTKLIIKGIKGMFTGKEQVA